MSSGHSHRFEILTRRVVRELPSPAPWDEVHKAVCEAREEYEKLTGESWDNIPHVSSYDEKIRVWFDIEVKEDLQ